MITFLKFNVQRVHFIQTNGIGRYGGIAVHAVTHSHMGYASHVNTHLREVPVTGAWPDRSPALFARTSFASRNCEAIK